MPYAFFEGGAPGREQTLTWCCRLIDICDEFWLFGLSDGTLFEADYVMRQGRSSCLRDFSHLFDDASESRRAELLSILTGGDSTELN
jgi:hypothetical protein